MKRFSLWGLAALAVVGALAGVASAASPTHTTNTGSGIEDFPVGTLCDFHYYQTFTFTDEITTFSNGRVQIHETLQVSHTNVGTGYTLTENDVLNITLNGDKVKLVGLGWHLRDANGKFVVVHAGQLVFDSSGLIKFTPNSGPDFAAVICPALGGTPA
jgi:hypothetical protein